MTPEFFSPFLLIFLLSSCGFFENDGTKSQKYIIGNIYVQQYRNTERIDLIFDEANEIAAVVVGDCRLVFYDSLRNEIYVESPITKSTSEHYRILVKDPFSQSIGEALEKKIIYKRTFDAAIKRTSAVEIKFK